MVRQNPARKTLCTLNSCCIDDMDWKSSIEVEESLYLKTLLLIYVQTFFLGFCAKKEREIIRKRKRCPQDHKTICKRYLLRRRIAIYERSTRRE